MTEAEAITIVIEQFAGPSGFVARLQRGQGIDAAAVHLAKQALQTLKEAWAERSTVPKEALLPLFDLMTTIRSTIELQPERTEEISRLAQDLTIQVAEIFGRESGHLSEEEAMAIVRTHFVGDSSFLLALHQGEGLDQSSVNEVQLALETLQHAWADRSEVPKVVVGPMLDAPDAVLEGYRFYPPEVQQQQELLSAALRKQIKQCLS
jgi:hypothetical protein